ncbi:uncharacterized protein LOC101732715 isoform X1 [Xenopus tropicalis]|uniref:Uncharacterized protein LOC101732715 isoform X1 n=1 Tax=Xenopus tropicalis TaxID=8364 RepID=A0A8J1JWM2_XENTR|nr:uncharacterized protein LOC101732715 isoform X1 [Xenopus tropicalis]
MASAPVPGGRSLSGLPSPHSDPEIEGEGFSGEASERGSHVGGSGVAFSSDEEPANIQQQQQLPTQAPTQPTRKNVAPREQAQSQFHKSLNRHHKAHMRKMDQQHVDSCVATNAYNAGQARQAAHESAMLALQQELVTIHRERHEAQSQHEARMESLMQARHLAQTQHKAALLSLQEEVVELKKQKLALLAKEKQQIAAPKPTEPTSSTSTAPPPAGSTRQLRKRK